MLFVDAMNLSVVILTGPIYAADRTDVLASSLSQTGSNEHDDASLALPLSLSAASEAFTYKLS